MSRDNEVYTEEVSKVNKFWVCDGPGEDGRGCDVQWEKKLNFSQNANVISANLSASVDEINLRQEYHDYQRNELRFFVTEDERFLSTSSKEYEPNPLEADGEIHLCDSCYEKIKPIFGMDGFWGQHEDEEKEDDEEDEQEDQNRLWQAICRYFPSVDG